MRAKKEVSFTFDIPRSSIGLSTNGSAALAAMRSRAAGLQTRDFSVDEANKAVVPLSPASEIDSQDALLLKYSDKARVAEQRVSADELRVGEECGALMTTVSEMDNS